ncbi:MAG TPA: DbpA RNA binding domain-containing protein, partial [Flavobacterium sp.]|nr:DbpA RNA binding domain-containing protein [Flavobacterium sp.]
RTGRAGKTGTSIVIVTKSEFRKIQQIERIIKTKFVNKPIPTGMEICEVQLLHLANKVKSVEVDPEIDQYLPKIEEALGDLSKEELIKKMFSVEFNRFIEYYKKQNSINSPRPREEGSERPTVNSDGSVRYFLNLGARDDFDWMSLKDFLRDTLDLGRDDLYKVDVKEGFSFFNTDAQHSDRVMEILNNMNHEGRRVNVEISTSDGGSGGGRSSRRDHNGRGDRRGSDRNSGSDRSDRGGFNRGNFGRRREDDRPVRNERKSSVRGDRPRRSN